MEVHAFQVPYGSMMLGFGPTIEVVITLATDDGQLIEMPDASTHERVNDVPGRVCVACSEPLSVVADPHARLEGTGGGHTFARCAACDHPAGFMSAQFAHRRYPR